MVLRPELDGTRQEPLYRQLAAYLASVIQSGYMQPGERLPATRELAGSLGVNRTTVSAAYEVLESEGLIRGEVGRGSFVAEKQNVKPIAWESLLQTTPAANRFPTTAAISFAASRPPAEHFPLDDFRESAREVLENSELPAILQLGSAGGFEPLRRFLLEEARQEGVLGREDDLLITNGCQQALDLLRRVLIRPGTRVAVEDPIYPGLKTVFAEGEAELVPVTCGPDGFDPALFVAARATCCVVTPSFQNPTGLSMSLQSREALIAGVARDQAILIENDIYAPLRYCGADLPSLKKLAPDYPTILLRSFSKVAFPGLRLGWVIGPRQLIAAMRDAKQRTDFHTDQFSQAVMLRFASLGRLRSHVEAMIAGGRERLQAVLESAEKFLPAGSQWTRPEGGLNLWITLPGQLDAGLLLDRCRRAGVSYQPGSVFGVHRSWPNSFRLSFGGCPPGEIRKGLEILGTVFRDELEEWRRAESEPIAALV